MKISRKILVFVLIKAASLFQVGFHLFQINGNMM